MKTLTALFFVLFLILAGVYWFVNRELAAFPDIAFETSSSNQAAAPGDDFEGWSFAVIGDLEGPTAVTDALISQLATENIELVVQLGDIVDSNPSVSDKQDKMESMLEKLDNLPVPVYHVPGNNDLIYNEELEIRTPELYQEVVSAELYKTVDYKNLHLGLLDNSYRRYGLPDEELAWLEKDLSKNKLPYTILFYHRPIKVPGEEFFGDDETETSRQQNKKFQELLSNYTIDRIFNGHLHTTLRYELDSIPVVITGGGGGVPQSIFGGEEAAFYHYYLVHVPDDGVSPIEIQLVSLK